jgi:uncharacterized SAM-binding protein YcdF (DUF218 family)
LLTSREQDGLRNFQGDDLTLISKMAYAIATSQEPFGHRTRNTLLFIIKKLVAPFLLPPGIFVLLLVVIGTALIFWRRWRMGLMNLALGFTLWVLSTAPLANGLMRGLEADFSIPASPSGDVILLLGGGTIDNVPDLSGTGAPSPQMMGRIVTAVRLYRRLKLPIVVTGGHVFEDDPIPESAVDKRFLMDLGIPGKMIIEEDRARDTQENARFTAAICRRKGFSKPILLTAAYHLKRACMAFHDAGMDVIPFPAYFLGSSSPSYAWHSLLPRDGRVSPCANALHEYLGILYYRMI